MCGTLRSAWAALRSEPFDLVRLNLGLPDALTLVLILTARDQVAGRILGLNLGADDHLVKPFDLDELQARMRALLRRAGGCAHPLLVHGELVIDPAAHTVLRAGPAGFGAAAAARPSTERLGLGRKIVGRVMDIHGGSFAQHAAAAALFKRCCRLCFPAVS